MYYDVNKQRCVADKEIQNLALPLDDPAALAELGFFALTIEKPEYNEATEGIEPDGIPLPSPDNFYHLFQKMRVYSLLDRHKELKKKAATAKRWDKETGGIWLEDGTHVLTGVDDQNRIATALQGMEQAGLTNTDFKAASGWTTVTLEQLKAIAAAIATHVEGCFKNERRLHEAIDACESVDAINAISLEEAWPNNDFRPVEKPEEEDAA